MHTAVFFFSLLISLSTLASKHFAKTQKNLKYLSAKEISTSFQKKYEPLLKNIRPEILKYGKNPSRLYQSDSKFRDKRIKRRIIRKSPEIFKNKSQDLENNYTDDEELQETKQFPKNITNKEGKIQESGDSKWTSISGNFQDWDEFNDSGINFTNESLMNSEFSSGSAISIEKINDHLIATHQSNNDYPCNFTDQALAIIRDLELNSFCFVSDSYHTCIKNEQAILVPKIKLYCNSSTPVGQIAQATNSTYRNVITVL